MRWQTKSQNLKFKSQEKILDTLLEIRGYKTKKEKDEFLSPKKPQDLTLENFEINKKEVDKAIKRIKQAIDNNEHIIVYGDYDVDGISGTAILWETLYQLTPNVLPYLPERISEGYGFNLESVRKLKSSAKGRSTSGRKNLKLIITVDQGVTAGDKIAQVKKELNIDVIVCDHHELPSKNIPCEALIHTTQVCAAAIAWAFAREIIHSFPNTQYLIPDTLSLVALATIADLEPLTGINRSLVKYGLEALNKTKRLGLVNLIKDAGVELGKVGTYEVGYILAPRINAMGRMKHAIEALRLLCTKKEEQSLELARVLSETNRDRQVAMEEIFQHSRNLFLQQTQGGTLPKFILVAHESYQEGVIGLAAGKLTEEFHRPSAVISIGEKYSKASARSINGFNIIDILREHFDLISEAGGHPMAAGFTLETRNIEVLRQRLISVAEKIITDDMLEKILKIDLEIPLPAVTADLYRDVQQLAPFGVGNPEPLFCSDVEVKDARVVGSEGKHLKLLVSNDLKQKMFSAIAFNQGSQLEKIQKNTKITLAYSLTMNQWNGTQSLELKVKDIKC